MASILYVATRGSDDPTMATFPFEIAVGAAQEGHEVSIALLGEAVVTMKDEVAEELHGFGTPPLREILPEVVRHGIPVYV